jgi:uncharacterized protein with FMN-binding domain
MNTVKNQPKKEKMTIHKVALYGTKHGVTYIALEGKERKYTKAQVIQHIKDVYGETVKKVSFEETKKWDDEMYNRLLVR